MPEKMLKFMMLILRIAQCGVVLGITLLIDAGLRCVGGDPH
jgi:hypothetical protein